MVLVIWEQWIGKVHDQLSTIYEEKFLTDVIVQVGKDKCEVHSFVISLFSKFFQNILKDARQEKNFELPFHICFTGVKFEALNTVFRFMYTGEMSVEDLLVGEILSLVDLLELQGLEDMRTYFTDWVNENPVQPIADCDKYSAETVNMLLKNIEADVIQVNKSSNDSDEDILIVSEIKSSSLKRKKSLLNKSSKKGKFKKEKVIIFNSENLKLKLLEDAKRCCEAKKRQWPLFNLSLQQLNHINQGSDGKNPKLLLSKEMSYFWRQFLAITEVERKNYIYNISSKTMKNVFKALLSESKMMYILNSQSIKIDVLDCIVFMLLSEEKLPLKTAYCAYDAEESDLRPHYEERVEKAVKLYQITDKTLNEICDKSWVPCNMMKEVIENNNIEGFLKFDKTFQRALRTCGKGIPLEEILAMDANLKYAAEFKGLFRHHMGKNISVPLRYYEIRVKLALNDYGKKLLTLEQAAKEHMVSYSVLCERAASFTEGTKAFSTLTFTSDSRKNFLGPEPEKLSQSNNKFIAEVKMLRKKIQAKIIPIGKSYNDDSSSSSVSDCSDSETDVFDGHNETWPKSPLPERIPQIKSEISHTSSFSNHNIEVDIKENVKTKETTKTYFNASSFEIQNIEVESEEIVKTEEKIKTYLAEDEIPQFDSENIKIELLREAEKYSSKDYPYSKWPLSHLFIDFVHQMNKDDGGNLKKNTKINLINEMSYFWHKFMALSDHERKEMFQNNSEKTLKEIYREILAGSDITEVLDLLSISLDVLDCTIFMLLYSKNLSLKFGDDAYNISEASLKVIYKDRIQRALSLFQTTHLSLIELCNNCWVPYAFVKEEIDEKNIEGFNKFDEIIQNLFNKCSEGTILDDILAQEENLKYAEEFKSILEHHLGKNITLPLSPYRDRIKQALNSWETKAMTVHEAAREYMVSYSTLCKRILTSASNDSESSPIKCENQSEDINVKSERIIIHGFDLAVDCEPITITTRSATEVIQSDMETSKSIQKMPSVKGPRKLPKFKDRIEAAIKDVKEDGLSILESFKKNGLKSKRNLNILKYNLERADSVLHISYDSRMTRALNAVQNGEMSVAEASQHFCVNHYVVRRHTTKFGKNAENLPKRNYVMHMREAFLAFGDGSSFDEICDKFNIDNQRCRNILQFNLNCDDPPVIHQYAKRIAMAKEAVYSTNIKVSEAAEMYLVNLEPLKRMVMDPRGGNGSYIRKWPTQMKAAIKSVQEGMSLERAFKVHGLKDKHHISILKFNAERDDPVIDIDYEKRFQMAVTAMRDSDMTYIDSSRKFCVNSSSLRYYDPRTCRDPENKTFFEDNMKGALLACKIGLDLEEAYQQFNITTLAHQHILQYNLEQENTCINEPYEERLETAKEAVIAGLSPAEAANLYLVSPKILIQLYNAARKKNGKLKPLKKAVSMTEKLDKRMICAINNCRNGMDIEKAFRISGMKSSHSMLCLKFNIERDDAPIDVPFKERLERAVEAKLEQNLTIESASLKFIVNQYALIKAIKARIGSETDKANNETKTKTFRSGKKITYDENGKKIENKKGKETNKVQKKMLDEKEKVNEKESEDILSKKEIETSKKEEESNDIVIIEEIKNKKNEKKTEDKFSMKKTENEAVKKLSKKKDNDSNYISTIDFEIEEIHEDKGHNSSKDDSSEEHNYQGASSSSEQGRSSEFVSSPNVVISSYNTRSMRKNKGKESNKGPVSSTPIKTYADRFKSALQACLDMTLKREAAAKLYKVSLCELNKSYDIEWKKKHGGKSTD